MGYCLPGNSAHDKSPGADLLHRMTFIFIAYIASHSGFSSFRGNSAGMLWKPISKFLEDLFSDDLNIGQLRDGLQAMARADCKAMHVACRRRRWGNNCYIFFSYKALQNINNLPCIYCMKTALLLLQNCGELCIWHPAESHRFPPGQCLITMIQVLHRGARDHSGRAEPVLPQHVIQACDRCLRSCAAILSSQLRRVVSLLCALPHVIFCA
ncbi:hypothetical protein [Herbaspirillum rubrisubalbicans]|uniref:hypothetical protein n=1 Tax=Herbaspirillum rubrisubalbicans TaxID=80842 RepID=UPI0011BF56B4|nr:hypothetical protein [Herbaspirillum rubrisubalbicans]